MEASSTLRRASKDSQYHTEFIRWIKMQNCARRTIDRLLRSKDRCQRLFSKRKLLKQAGEWAIVTGATDGIGKVYAEELANDGLKIMLISRNEEKLLNVANEIERNYHVETRIVTADFTKVSQYK
ncbi:unnamed protein product [Schistosoma margrebowiei]|uniref:Uncharacterized protein n=1 Tax=Schistosoma margrebowiei TaxID=48269 RepID=A0A183N7I6_9TREM|nr:unnamed protein product [Schistosoma margrebowiei]